MKNLVKNNSKTNSSAASGIEEKLWYSLWLEKVKTKPHSTLKKMTKQWNNAIKQVDESNIKENCLDLLKNPTYFLTVLILRPVKGGVLRIMDDKLMIHVNKNTNSLNETNENQCLLILLIKLFKSDYERFC